jgi:hypothetical protein
MKHGWVKDSARDFDKAISLDPKGENKWANRARILKAQLEKGTLEKNSKLQDPSSK